MKNSSVKIVRTYEKAEQKMEHTTRFARVARVSRQQAIAAKDTADVNTNIASLTSDGRERAAYLYMMTFSATAMNVWSSSASGASGCAHSHDTSCG
jgi:hypothetical protein